MASRPQNREQVYCHSCEHVWYRDEHGLVCPNCQSDAVEIIEAEHDPRDFSAPRAPDAPEPAFRSVRLASGSQVGGEHLLQNLFSQIGGMTPDEAIRAHSGASPSNYNRGPAPNPYTRAPPAPPFPPSPWAQHPPQQGTRTQYQFGPFNVTMTTSSQTYFNGQPVGPGAGGHDEDVRGMLQRAFAPIQPNLRNGPGNTIIYSTGGTGAQAFTTPAGGGGSGGGGGAGAFGGLTGPLAMLLSTMGIPHSGGQMGDVVFSNEAMDRIISQLMEQNQQGTAPGPASADAINGLPKIKVTPEMLDEKTQTADCPICLVNVEIGEEVVELPCKHWFHFECVQAWLSEHDTCPSCRRGITPAEGDTNRVRETGEPPRHWQTPESPNLSRSNTNQQDSPAASAGPSLRETVSASVRNAVRNGIMGWMGRPRDEQQADSATQTQGRRQEQTQSTTTNSGGGTAASGGRQTTNRSRLDDLDMPEVD